MNGFIEGELFQEKRRNLTFYERIRVILFDWSRGGFIKGKLFHDKIRNLIGYDKFGCDFIDTES
jgi:hypothetical protein